MTGIEQTPRHVDVEWLREHLDDPQVRVLDATVHLSFDEHGAHVESGRAAYEREHVPGAAFVDLIGGLSDPDGEAPFAAAPSERFAQVLGEAGVGDDSHVVVYDSVNGIWATRLWWQLGLEGFDRVSVLDGGLAAWRAAGLDTSAGVETYPAATFTARRLGVAQHQLERAEAAWWKSTGWLRHDAVVRRALHRQHERRRQVPRAVLRGRRSWPTRATRCDETTYSASRPTGPMYQ